MEPSIPECRPPKDSVDPEGFFYVVMAAVETEIVDMVVVAVQMKAWPAQAVPGAGLAPPLRPSPGVMRTVMSSDALLQNLAEASVSEEQLVAHTVPPAQYSSDLLAV